MLQLLLSTSAGCSPRAECRSRTPQRLVHIPSRPSQSQRHMAAWPVVYDPVFLPRQLWRSLCFGRWPAWRSRRSLIEIFIHTIPLSLMLPVNTSVMCLRISTSTVHVPVCCTPIDNFAVGPLRPHLRAAGLCRGGGGIATPPSRFEARSASLLKQ